MSAASPVFEPSVSGGGSLLGHRVGMVIDQAGHRDERAVRQLEELAAAGADVRAWSIRPDIWGDEPETIERGGVTYRRCQLGPDGGFISAWTSMNEATLRHLEGWAEAEMIDWDPTIVAHHSDATLQFGVELAERLNRPLVSDLPDLPRERPTSADPWYRSRRPSRYYPSVDSDRLMRDFYRRATRHITVSPGLARELSRRYRVVEPVVILNVPGPQLSGLGDSEVGDVRSSVGVGADTPLMVFVGNVKHGLNIEAILEAVDSSPEWHLALVGSHEWQLKKFGLAEKIVGGLVGRVHVVERQPDGHLPQFLSTADCGVFIPHATHFNLNNCAPNKFFAMALAGIPVIVSDLPFLASEVRRLGIGCVAAGGTAKGLTRALPRARGMYSDVRSLRESIRYEYGWERQKDVLIATYLAAADDVNA